MIALDYYVDDSANGITLGADLHLHFDAGDLVLMPLLMPPNIGLMRAQVRLWIHPALSQIYLRHFSSLSQPQDTPYDQCQI